MKCPVCNGGENKFVHFPAFPHGKMRKKMKCLSEKELLKLFPCLQCNGSGEVPEKMEQWIKDGEGLKNKRIAAGLTLRNAGIYLKIQPSKLSEMERGVIEPDRSIEYNTTVLSIVNE